MPKRKSPPARKVPVQPPQTQVAFAFKAALHTDQERPCRLSGELCLWMEAHESGDPLDRRVVASGSSITGRVISSRDPSHLGSSITGRVASDGSYMELTLCGLESLRVYREELSDWEEGEGGPARRA